QRRVRFDAAGEQFVEQAVVEIEPLGVWLPGSFGKHPRPCDRKPVGLGPQSPDEANVFLVAVIVLVGAVAIASVRDLARRVAKSVPDRPAAAVFVDRALDLIRGGRRAPQKALRKTRRSVPVGSLLCVGDLLCG